MIGKYLKNVYVQKVVCYCDKHEGETLEQVNAELPNGKPIVILRDSLGLHVAIGGRNTIGEFPYTPPVSEKRAVQMIQEALKS